MTNEIMTIGFASTNANKLKEVEACFKSLGVAWEVVSLAFLNEVDETGSTFCDNALIKLHAALDNPESQKLDIVFAEDSGLIIDALDGRYGLSPFPGVRSDRWFSEDVQQELLGQKFESPTYQEKNLGILKLMKNISNRSARYEACVAVWIQQVEKIFTVSGKVDLSVAKSPQGQNGFGYDPIMMANDEQTMAELSLDAKNQISHRRQALQQLVQAVQVYQKA